MQCINNFGGYLCLPKNAVISLTKEEIEQAPLPDPPPQVPVPPSQPQFPPVFSGGHRGSQTSLSIRCSVGFAADEQNLCRGKITNTIMWHSLHSCLFSIESYRKLNFWSWNVVAVCRVHWLLCPALYWQNCWWSFFFFHLNIILVAVFQTQCCCLKKKKVSCCAM